MMDDESYGLTCNIHLADDRKPGRKSHSHIEGASNIGGELLYTYGEVIVRSSLRGELKFKTHDLRYTVREHSDAIQSGV